MLFERLYYNMERKGEKQEKKKGMGNTSSEPFSSKPKSTKRARTISFFTTSSNQHAHNDKESLDKHYRTLTNYQNFQFTSKNSTKESQRKKASNGPTQASIMSEVLGMETNQQREEKKESNDKKGRSNANEHDHKSPKEQSNRVSSVCRKCHKKCNCIFFFFFCKKAKQAHQRGLSTPFATFVRKLARSSDIDDYVMAEDREMSGSIMKTTPLVSSGGRSSMSHSAAAADDATSFFGTKSQSRFNGLAQRQQPHGGHKSVASQHTNIFHVNTDANEQTLLRRHTVAVSTPMKDKKLLKP
ncbi:hypothetical protein RFI_10864, partial [Reticulomyxa filosa]